MQTEDLTTLLVGDFRIPSETELLRQDVAELQKQIRGLREEMRVLMEDQPMKWR